MDTIVEQYRKLAKKGYADAQFKLGLAYAEGKGVRRDQDKALKWFRKAAEQGHTEARLTLELTELVDREEIIRKAAEEGDVNAQVNLSFLYSKGLGVRQDYTEAAKGVEKPRSKATPTRNSRWGSCPPKARESPKTAPLQ